MKRLYLNLMARVHMINAQLLREQGRYIDAAQQEGFAREYETELFRLQLERN